MIRLLTGLVIMAFAGAALAQKSAPPVMGEQAKAMLGDWEFSNAERSKICVASFKHDKVKVGFKVTFDAQCAGLFPLVEKIAGWRFPDDDDLFLLDAAGQPLAEFSEVEGGIYEAPTPGVGVLFLQAPGAASPVQKTAQDLVGTWAVTRAGATVCTLTLAADPAGDGFAVTVQPGCDPALAGLAFSQWKIDGSELQLMPAKGGAWRFVEGDGGNWQRIAETADQVMLVRQ
jgi:hypothetical protein